MTTRALVIGGGGVAGIAWETGVLAGLSEAGIAVTDADVVIGTSAGSTVAAQVTSGLTVAELLARQVDPALQVNELVPEISLPDLWETIGKIIADATDVDDARRRLRSRLRTRPPGSRLPHPLRGSRTRPGPHRSRSRTRTLGLTARLLQPTGMSCAITRACTPLTPSAWIASVSRPRTRSPRLLRTGTEDEPVPLISR